MVDELRKTVMLAAAVVLVTRTTAFGPYPVLVLCLSHRFYHLWMISVAVNMDKVMELGFSWVDVAGQTGLCLAYLCRVLQVFGLLRWLVALFVAVLALRC